MYQMLHRSVRQMVRKCVSGPRREADPGGGATRFRFGGLAGGRHQAGVE